MLQQHIIAAGIIRTAGVEAGQTGQFVVAGADGTLGAVEFQLMEGGIAGRCAVQHLAEPIELSPKRTLNLMKSVTPTLPSMVTLISVVTLCAS
jgi:hypothetical protein